MGFIVQDNVELTSGLIVKDLYFNIAGNMIYCCREQKPDNTIVFKYHCSFNIYASKLLKDQDKPMIQQQFHQVELQAPLNDPYKEMYDSMKQNFSSVIDD